MALLQQILYKVNILSVAGTADTEVNDLQTDSRKVNQAHALLRKRNTN